MTTYAPDYYKEFKCIKNLCKHNCCIGWEIQIDDDTRKKYLSDKNDFSNKIRENITKGDDCHFILKEDLRCPFLNGCNLCEIITNLGKDYLCQICSDHPRYINLFETRKETGLGLCCEAAAKIILSKKDKVCFIPLNDETTPTDEEKEFFDLRQSLLDIIQNRNLNIKERIKNLNTGVENISFEKIFDILYNLEKLDCSWNDSLQLLNSSLPFSEIELDLDFQVAFEQLLVYFIARHLSDAYFDFREEVAISFAVFSTMAIMGLCSGLLNEHGKFDFDVLLDFARAYSAEIEYNEENLDNIFSELESI